MLAGKIDWYLRRPKLTAGGVAAPAAAGVVWVGAASSAWTTPARNNGMTAVGVLYGYGSQAELRDAGAHHVCATPQGVLEHAG